MKFLKLALCATAASAALSGVAMAQEAPSVSFNVGATSDYVFRGLTQSEKDPAVFAGADISSGPVYGGVWASSVGFADAEVDLYAGVKPALGPVTFDLGVIYYGYVGSDVKNAAYWEGKVAASIAAGPGTLGLAYYYSPEFFGKTGKADYWELNGSVPVGTVTLSGAIGRQSLAKSSYGVTGYSTGNVGATIPLYEDKITLDLRYIYTDDDAKVACVGCSVNKAIATIKAVF